jgi:carboxypeptidase T
MLKRMLPAFLAAHGSERLPGPYRSCALLLEDFQRAASAAGGAESTVGRSVRGRPLLRFDLGTPGKPVVFLSALMHGTELIGALALLDVLRELAACRDRRTEELLNDAHLVVLPVVNPDALDENLTRLARGRRAWQRCNANGVDLNRNFPRLTERRMYHPLAGSRLPFSPYYAGPYPLSEPESRAVQEVASATRPVTSIAFHSFGNLLLYPWAYTKRMNPRTQRYRDLGRALASGLRRFPYSTHQARQFYSMLGELDDFLDAEFGALAVTLEVSRPKFGFDRARLSNPFWWMNPVAANEVVKDLTPGVIRLLTRALELRA